MRVLVTAGGTDISIDKVRKISNIFGGRTGTEIAEFFRKMGMDVTLFTSALYITYGIKCKQFHSFEELKMLMDCFIKTFEFDIIIHSAAVSDYYVNQVLIRTGDELRPIDSTNKISSSHEQLYLELKPTIKLVDQIRSPWGFSGKLVKFKLEVGISDEELIKIAETSRKKSQADYIVANCLEWYRDRAYILGGDGFCESVLRSELPKALFELIGERK